MYETDWYNSGDVVPDQVTPASDAIPSNSIVNGSAGTSNEYARGDHQHPLQVSTVLPAKDTANGEVGVATTYARSDHTHHVNLSNDVPLKDTGTGTAGTANIYASTTHQHPLNVDLTTANVPLVNATAAANGTSDFYSRNDHVHPQQLTYDKNITATKFIKTGGLATEILCANGDTTTDFVTKTTTQTITGIKTFNNIFQIVPTGTDYNEGIRIAKATNGSCQIFFGVDPNEHSGFIEGQWTAGIMLSQGPTVQQFSICQSSDYANASRGLRIATDGNTLTFNGNGLVDVGTDQTINGIKTFSKLLQINPTFNGTFNEGIRISRHPSNQWSNIQFGCDPNKNTGKVDNQWLAGSTGNNGTNPLGFIIVKAGEEGQADRGLQISADGNTLTFTGSVIAGTGATNGASNGSVQYSAGNPIRWGVNSTGTEGGFYSNGTNICWRARPITLGSVPP
ncbi:MAG: hypothetical protein EZS28_020728 [Streblomastix strix]|uniref:Uncharacterized protein n=1 Tax=Streblomastix strix TaxID=222440 RepID=A0A5J4VMQ6_9EUKA|nr:MAG: hypothetical protein EZS28_020728 [Streblomastix strix]